MIFKLKTVTDYQEAEEYKEKLENEGKKVKIEVIDNLNYEVINIIAI